MDDLGTAIIRSPPQCRTPVPCSSIDVDVAREEGACDGGAAVFCSPVQRGAVEFAIGDDEAPGVFRVEEEWNEGLAVEGRAVDVQVGGGGENITDEWLVVMGSGVVEGCGREGGLCGEGVEDGGEERTKPLVGCVQAAEGGGGEVVG